ncbi:MAG: DUF1570 domain-containing protein, partial [Planctomycetota bacterium]
MKRRPGRADNQFGRAFFRQAASDRESNTEHDMLHAGPTGRIRIAALALATAALASPAFAQRGLKSYDSRYYRIYTDLDPESVREVQLRIERMAETYHQRTRAFAGKISERLPFYMFRTPQAYYAAGGLRGSGGLFDGERLMIIAGNTPTQATWQLMQHEGFHQFAHAVIGGEFPPWINEGMAEYFAESIFTGDGYVTGAIPPQRLARLKHWIDQGHTISIEEMMEMPHAAWNANLNVTNYDQAWSMVYFLAHGDNGRYQDALNGLIRDTSRGVKWQQAWQRHFGGTRAFERRWRAYWRNMSDNPTADLYARATVLKVTSFYARAFSQRQIYNDFESFLQAARAHRLRMHK